MNRSDRLILAAILMVILVQLVICNYLFFGPMVTLTLLPVTVLFIRDSSPPLLSAQDRSLLFPIFPTKSKRAFCPLYFIFI